MQRYIRLVAAGSVSLSLWGCAPRPEPKALDPRQVDPFDLIAYRALTRDDFRGPVADRSLTAASHATAPRCTSISVAPREVVTRLDGTNYVSSLDNPVFFAMFDRGCSWPSPDDSHPDADVLEHEQIHFAIGEVEARRMNGRAEAIVLRIRSVGTDRETTSRRAALELQAVLAEAEEACLARDILFDDQVRGDRVRQRQWFQKITSDLAATDMFARGPQTMLPVAVASAAPPVLPEPAPPARAASPRKSLTPTSAALPAPAPQPAPAAPSPPPPAPAPAPAPQPTPATSPTSTGAFPD